MFNLIPTEPEEYKVYADWLGDQGVILTDSIRDGILSLVDNLDRCFGCFVGFCGSGLVEDCLSNIKIGCGWGGAEIGCECYSSGSFMYRINMGYGFAGNDFGHGGGSGCLT